MIIDSHTHVWTLEPRRYPWQPIGGYIPEAPASYTTLRAEMQSAGVDRAVLVQPTPYGWNNCYLLDVVKTAPDAFRAVCLVDPFSLGGPAELERLVHDHGVSGVRINWHLEKPQRWLDDPAHLALWAKAQQVGAPICLQLTPPYLPLVRTFARRYPGVKIVIDHLGRPEVGSNPTAASFVSFLALCELPQVYVKIAGLYYYSLGAAPYEDTWELVKAAVATFTPQRCLWGSDFPFVDQRWSYPAMIDTLRDLFKDPQALDWILGKTAETLWP